MLRNRLAQAGAQRQGRASMISLSKFRTSCLGVERSGVDPIEIKPSPFMSSKATEFDREVLTWMVGKGKAFAAWTEIGDQPGAHLRVNSPGDTRLKPSALELMRLEKKNNFVWLDPKATWAEGEIEALLAHSYTLAARKDGGIKRGGEFHDLYLAVRQALKATPSHLRPPGPHHAGGPAAKILKVEAAFAAKLARWAAEELAPTVPEAEKPAHAKLMAVLVGKTSTHAQLWLAQRDSKTPAIRAVSLAMAARGGSLSAPSYAADAVMVLHAHLLATAPEKLTAFVTHLDETVLNAEFSAVAEERTNKPDVSCERVLWRGADAKGNAGRWVARLAEGRYVLIQKVGKKWEWIEGSRDDVLASVPDTEFKNATSTALLRDER